MVFYRKYRSQTVGELDLKEVREKLTSILQSKDIAHAFLFTGPRGLGKTSAARILAKAINCEKKLKVEKGELKIGGSKNSQLSTLNSQLSIDAIIFPRPSMLNLDNAKLNVALNQVVSKISGLV